jgi:predicted transcriptional regulator
LEVMKVLWEVGTGTVAQVQIELRRLRPFAYTTVMTLLDRLAKKGAVSRLRQGRGYVYTPVLDRDTALKLALHRLMRDFFNGFPAPLISYLQTVSPQANSEETQRSPAEPIILQDGLSQVEIPAAGLP